MSVPKVTGGRPVAPVSSPVGDERAAAEGAVTTLPSTTFEGWQPRQGGVRRPTLEPTTSAAAVAGWENDFKGLSSRLSSAMGEAGARLGQASGLLGAFAPQAVVLATAFNGFATRLKTGEVASGLVSHIHASATNLLSRAQTLADAVRGDVGAGVHEGLTMLGQTVDSVRQATTEYVEGVKHAVDYRENIGKLGPGDTYNLGLFAYVGIEGVRLNGSGNVTVNRRADGTFAVSVDGEVAGGLFLQVGGTVMGRGAMANLSASAIGGGAVEYSFATAEDASRGVAALLNPTAEGATAFLAGHQSALELRGGGDVLGWGLVGLKGPLSLSGATQGKALVSMRVEAGRNGAPAQLVMQQTVKATVDASAAFDRRVFVNMGGGKAAAEVVAEQRYVLPASLTLEALSQDPIGLLKQVAPQLEQTRTDSVKVRIAGKALLTGNGAGACSELKSNTSIADWVRSGALGHVLRGDVPAALSALPAEARVEGSTSHTHTSGVHTGPWFSVMGFGVGVEFDASRNDVLDESVKRFGGSAREVAARWRH